MTRNGNSSGQTILMVENEAATACLLEFVLEKNGYRVVHSNNGVHVKALIATMEPPNLVLLDMASPDTNGLDLLAYLRTQTHWQKTAVALLTTSVDNFDMRQAALLGAPTTIFSNLSAQPNWPQG